MSVKKFLFFMFLLSTFIILNFAYTGCDEYQSESYQISSGDLNACIQLKDTLYNEITLLPLTHFNANWTHEIIPDSVTTVLDSLKSNNLILQNTDESTWIHLVAGEDTNYVCFQTDLSAVTVYSNLIIDLMLMDSEGNTYSASDRQMPMETVGGCTTEEGLPFIKTRVSFNSPEHEYLMYVMVKEQTIFADADDPVIIFSVLNKQ